MLLNPAIIAIVSASLAVGLFVCYAACAGVYIWVKWDIDSPSEQQLMLERKTYLISTILSFALVIEIVSLFFFVVLADRLHSFFTGAMCAAGTLNAGSHGYGTLGLKLLSAFLCGVWLILNRADNLCYDYPFMKHKYGLLVFIGVAIVFENMLQLHYFSDLDPQIITSCCGTFFNTPRPGMVSEVIHLPSAVSGLTYYSATLPVLAAGGYIGWTGRGTWLYGVLSFFLFPLALVAFVSCFCIYFYELPTHHCPFCILQREYGYSGYFLYGLLLTGVVSGVGCGIIGILRHNKECAFKIRKMRTRLCRASVLAYGIFTAWVTRFLIFSDVTLAGP